MNIYFGHSDMGKMHIEKSLATNLKELNIIKKRKEKDVKKS
jgi:hypothetical protein